MNSSSEAPVAVNFAVTFDYQRYYTEAEIAAGAIESQLRSARTLEGAIIVRVGDAPAIEVVDELVPQILAYMRRYEERAVAALQRAGPA